MRHKTVNVSEVRRKWAEQEMRDVSRKFYKARWERNKREKVKIGKSKSASPIAGSAGERAYCKAIENGAPTEQLDQIITENLPEEFREQPMIYQANTP